MRSKAASDFVFSHGYFKTWNKYDFAVARGYGLHDSKSIKISIYIQAVSFVEKDVLETGWES